MVFGLTRTRFSPFSPTILLPSGEEAKSRGSPTRRRVRGSDSVTFGKAEWSRSCEVEMVCGEGV